MTQSQIFDMRKRWIAKLLIAILAIYAAMQIKNQCIVIAKIPTSSMEPTICAGSYVLGIKKNIDTSKIEREDIVFFEHNAQIYAKRVIAVPGDSLTIADGSVYINGNIYEEEYVKENWDVTREVYSYNIPLYKYFVMGDNRLNSDDSRQWGYVSEKDIFAEAKWIIYPFSKITKLGE